MKSKEEILKKNVESIAKCNVTYNITHQGILNAMEEYATQCQEDIADNWIKVEDIEKGFEQFYPNGEKCEFTAHAAAQICEVIFKNKINKQD